MIYNKLFQLYFSAEINLCEICSFPNTVVSWQSAFRPVNSKNDIWKIFVECTRDDMHDQYYESFGVPRIGVKN